MADNDDTFTYILYVYPGEKKSNLAINKISWGPTALSVDGLIRYEDIRIMKRVFKSLPPWLTVVPTLVNIKTRMMYPGSKCFEELDAYFLQQKQPANAAAAPQSYPRGFSPSQPLVVEDLRTILPKDPRDSLTAAVDDSPTTQQQQAPPPPNTTARDVFLMASSNRGRSSNKRPSPGAAAVPQFAREELMMMEIGDAPTPVAAAPTLRAGECDDDAGA